MSHSEFPVGISAVAASQFGGGQSYFAERQANLVKNDEKLTHHLVSLDENDEQEAEEDENSNSESEPEAKKDTGFEPTYDLSKGAEHHPHVGLLLDVKL